MKAREEELQLKPRDATVFEVDEPSPERFPLVNPQSVSDSDFEYELTPRTVKLQPRKRKNVKWLEDGQGPATVPPQQQLDTALRSTRLRR